MPRNSRNSPRVLTPEQVRDGVPVFARLYAEVESLYPKASEKLRFNETLKRILDRLVSDLITHSGKLITASGVRSEEEVRRFPRRLFAFSPEVEEERRHIKEFLYQNVYDSELLQIDHRQAEQVVSDLFAFFMKSPEELPAGYQEKLQQEQLYRIVCDYIAGMTDSYILDQHRRFCPGRERISV